MTYVIYVLDCADGRFYVGRCPAERLRARVHEHMHGRGAEFTRRFPASRLWGPARRSDDPLEEDLEVLRMMRVHGVDRVRGGSWSGVHLPSYEVVHIQRRLDHAAGRCLRCGDLGHAAGGCRCHRAS